MSLRYDGKVAIVTGAGIGLGKSYALLLARHGAKVVVNDLGGAMSGAGSSTAVADNVVAEIKAAGGEAVANYDSVTSGEKIVKTAIDAYGRVDIIINNAGVLRDVSFKKMTDKDWDLVYEVHMKGAYAVTRAAWPYMLDQGYGRIVNISSPAGLYGNFGQVNYSAMKRGVIGFSKALAREGATKNVKANVIAPLAKSRMLETVFGKDVLDKLPTETIAEIVGYLAHESCEPNGGVFEVAGSYISKLRWQRSKGVNLGENFTSKDVAANIDEISDFEKGADYPDDAFGLIEKVAGKSKL